MGVNCRTDQDEDSSSSTVGPGGRGLWRCHPPLHHQPRRCCRRHRTPRPSPGPSCCPGSTSRGSPCCSSSSSCCPSWCPSCCSCRPCSPPPCCPSGPLRPRARLPPGTSLPPRALPRGEAEGLSVRLRRARL